MYMYINIYNPPPHPPPSSTYSTKSLQPTYALHNTTLPLSTYPPPPPLPPPPAPSPPSPQPPLAGHSKSVHLISAGVYNSTFSII